MIEVEIRALLEEQDFLKLADLLVRTGKDLGRDDKDTHFYVFADKVIKVADEISKIAPR